MPKWHLQLVAWKYCRRTLSWTINSKKFKFLGYKMPGHPRKQCCYFISNFHAPLSLSNCMTSGIIGTLWLQWPVDTICVEANFTLIKVGTGSIGSFISSHYHHDIALFLDNVSSALYKTTLHLNWKLWSWQIANFRL